MNTFPIGPLPFNVFQSDKFPKIHRGVIVYPLSPAEMVNDRVAISFFYL